MLWNMMSQGRQAFIEWRQKKTLRDMLNDPRSAKGCRSIGQLEKGIAADRATTERLLLTIGARRTETSEQWTLAPAGTACRLSYYRAAASRRSGLRLVGAMVPTFRVAPRRHVPALYLPTLHDAKPAPTSVSGLG